MCDSPNCGCKTGTKPKTIADDWSFLNAYRLMNPESKKSNSEILGNKFIEVWSVYHRVGLYIELSEEPPIDPDLVLARETVANAQSDCNGAYLYSLDIRRRIKEGSLYAKYSEYVLKGIKLGKSLC